MIHRNADRQDPTREEVGIMLLNICCKYAISKDTYPQCGSMQVLDTKKMKEIKAENSKLKKMFAGMALKNAVPKDVIEKMLKPIRSKGIAQYMVKEHRLSIHWVCSAIKRWLDHRFTTNTKKKMIVPS